MSLYTPGDVILYKDNRPKLVRLMSQYTKAVSNFFSEVFTSKRVKEQRKARERYFELARNFPRRPFWGANYIIYADKKPEEDTNF